MTHIFVCRSLLTAPFHGVSPPFLQETPLLQNPWIMFAGIDGRVSPCVSTSNHMTQPGVGLMEESDLLMNKSCNSLSNLQSNMMLCVHIAMVFAFLKNPSCCKMISSGLTLYSNRIDPGLVRFMVMGI